MLTRTNSVAFAQSLNSKKKTQNLVSTELYIFAYDVVDFIYWAILQNISFLKVFS